MEGGSVAYAGGDGDDRDSYQTSYYAGESAFHAGADDDDSGVGEDALVGEEAVDAGYSYVVEVPDPIAHELGGDYRFFGYGDVAGSGGDYGDGAFGVSFSGDQAVALEGDAAG